MGLGSCIRLAVGLLAALAVTALPGSIYAQVEDHTGHDHSQSADAGMAAWQESMTPGPHHKAMAEAAGDWVYSSRFWMDPSGPATEVTGEARMEIVMNGLFLVEDTSALMMGQAWNGHGVFGYDNVAKKHIGIWYDSFGSYIMNFEGDCDGQCNVVTTYSDYMDPMTGTAKRMKTVSTHDGPDKISNAMFDVAPDGTETRIMEIDYTRKK